LAARSAGSLEISQVEDVSSFKTEASPERDVLRWYDPDGYYAHNVIEFFNHFLKKLDLQKSALRKAIAKAMRGQV
jgi:hypothetical protein